MRRKLTDDHEIDPAEIAFELLARLARVRKADLKAGSLAVDEWCRVSEAASALASLPLYVEQISVRYDKIISNFLS